MDNFDLRKYLRENKLLKEDFKKSKVNEIKGFKEFKEAGLKLGDKIEFMGSAHPAHTKPIKLTGIIEYFEPGNEIGVRVDGYGSFIPLSHIQSEIKLVKF
jgi:hypothetical protein